MVNFTITPKTSTTMFIRDIHHRAWIADVPCREIGKVDGMVFVSSPSIATSQFGCFSQPNWLAMFARYLEQPPIRLTRVSQVMVAWAFRLLLPQMQPGRTPL